MTVAENVETRLQPLRDGNCEVTRFNALQHGVLSRYTVLPWEDQDEYRALIEALVAEHSPHGPTEEHLVEELAGIIWRKRRLRLGEAAVHHRALKRTIDPFQETAEVALIHITADHENASTGEAVRAEEGRAKQDLADLEADQAMTEKAIDLLRTRSPKAYAHALAELGEDLRASWRDQLSCKADDYEEDETPFRANAKSLRRFLEGGVMPWYGARRRELEHRPLIRAQAFW